jgi:Protein of unknown function (DUF3074)
MSSVFGPLVRLEGISINQLPPGAVTAATSSKSGSAALDLKTFIKNAITEAVPFIDGVAPKSGGETTWRRKGSARRYAASDAAVYSYERIVPGKELDKIPGMNQFSADRRDETWFCRRSCHRNAAEKGTGSWEEFVYHFKDHKYESEAAFTSAIIGAREAITWDTKGLSIEAHGGRWVDIIMKVVEMKHKIDPKPLRNRIFPVLQLAASLAGAQELIVVSIPIPDIDKSPHAEYAKEKNQVIAAYSAVERMRVLPDSGEIEWIMATASNAGGILPQWLQNLAVPGQIAHDVGMFLVWIPSQRKSNGARPTVVRSSTFDKNLPPAPAQSETASMVTAPPPPISKTAEEPPPIDRRESTNKILPLAPSSSVEVES